MIAMTMRHKYVWSWWLAPLARVSRAISQRKSKVRASSSLHTPSPGTPCGGVGSHVWPLGLVFINRNFGNTTWMKRRTLAEEGVYFKMTRFKFRDWDYAPWET